MRMALAVPALMGLAVLGACSNADGGARWEGTVTDSAGIEVVRNPATGMWRAGDEWTLTEALRIGTAEGEPEYQFGQIPAAAGAAVLAVASDGRIVVLDQQAQHLKMFGSDGKYERTIGGPGGGPGELGPGASAVLISPGDSILVSDIGNQRANLYLLDGTFVRSFPVNFTDGIPLRWESAPDGRIVAQLRRFAFPGSTAPPDTMDLIAVRRLDGTVGDTLMRVPSGKTFSFSGGAPEFNFFTAEPAWALSADGLLYGVSNQYRIGVYGPGGALTRIVEKPFQAPPVAQADQDAIKDLLRKAWSDAGVPNEVMGRLMSGVHFAPQYPAYAGFMSGVDGSLWVQHLQAPSLLTPEQREGFNPQYDLFGREWDVFDGQGRFLGVLSMPLRFQPVRFLGDKVYGIQRDELDVQYVVVLSLTKPGDDS